MRNGGGREGAKLPIGLLLLSNLLFDRFGYSCKKRRHLLFELWRRHRKVEKLQKIPIEIGVLFEEQAVVVNQSLQPFSKARCTPQLSREIFSVFLLHPVEDSREQTILVAEVVAQLAQRYPGLFSNFTQRNRAPSAGRDGPIGCVQNPARSDLSFQCSSHLTCYRLLLGHTAIYKTG